MKYKGKKLEEITKGSLDYQRMEILTAFRNKFPDPEGGWYSVEEVFTDHLIVSTYGSGANAKLMPDEFYRVEFSKSESGFEFGSQPWPVVELTYRPAGQEETMAEIGESQKRKKGKRLVESINQSLTLNESEADDDNLDGPWRIKGIGITADVINGNYRIYPARVLEAAVQQLKAHLNESAGQGRILSVTTGEADHPEDKGNRRSMLMETVINWDNVTFDGRQVLLEGNLLGTAKGKDIRALMKGGVRPGISQRANGDSRIVKRENRNVEEITELVITGYDLTAQNEQSDPEAGTTYYESKQLEENKMNLLEKLLALLEARPDLFTNVSEDQLRAMSESQLQTLLGKVSEAMKIDLSKVNISESLREMSEKATRFDESQRSQAITVAIDEATKELPYGDEGNKTFVEGIRSANPQDAAGVKSLVEAKRKEYDKIFAGRKLEARGFTGRITGVAPVLEAETGVPEFARGAFQLAESIRRENHNRRPDFRNTRTVNEDVTARILEKFDRDNKQHLMLESRLLQEAETTSDLNLPYSVSRSVIEEAFPALVALGIFDVDTTDQAPSKIFYETFSGETGYTGAISADEVVTIAALDTWYSLANKRITPGTLVVKNEAEDTTYDYGSDYVVDYANGRIKALTGGDITAADVLHLTAYSYTAIRKGENVGIERGKLTLASKTLEIAADRLADEVTREAIVFGRSQLGWDAIGRTLDSLVKQVRRKIDNGLIYLSLSAVLSVPNNSGGTWTAASDSLDLLVQKLGTARVKVANRYYEPTSYLSSLTNVEKLSHWSGFTAAGKRPGDERMGNGFAGSINGLPVFWSTEHPDGYFQSINRQIVMHRIFQAMLVKGPYPSFDSNLKLKANDQYYVEEFNGSDAPVPEKGAYVIMA
jgi:hypothetical protein